MRARWGCGRVRNRRVRTPARHVPARTRDDLHLPRGPQLPQRPQTTTVARAVARRHRHAPDVRRAPSEPPELTTNAPLASAGSRRGPHRATVPMARSAHDTIGWRATCPAPPDPHRDRAQRRDESPERVARRRCEALVPGRPAASRSAPPEGAWRIDGHRDFVARVLQHDLGTDPVVLVDDERPHEVHGRDRTSPSGHEDDDQGFLGAR